MTATTITPIQVVTAIFTNLNAYTDLTDVVGDDIAEENYMEFDFSYPAVRVGINEMPVGDKNGNCHGEWFDLSFSVFVFIEGKSSLACQDIMGIIARRFQNQILSSADFTSLSLDTTYINPVPFDVDAWRGEVMVTGQLKEL